ncbi:hypothetical protein NXV71_02865 [Bacteroides fragilis]|nr:hypothetical protein [Bacteroides fragilis]
MLSEHSSGVGNSTEIAVERAWGRMAKGALINRLRHTALQQGCRCYAGETGCRKFSFFSSFSPCLIPALYMTLSKGTKTVSVESSGGHVYCEKNIWFRALGTLFEQVIKDSIPDYSAKRQCKGLSRFACVIFIRSCL